MFEKVPTVYRPRNGKSVAICQFLTNEAAVAYVAELVAEGQAPEFVIKMSDRRPIRRAYDRRGVWRTSGVQLVER